MKSHSDDKPTGADLDALVQRLLALAAKRHASNVRVLTISEADTAAKAADAITDLRAAQAAEIARLTAERDNDRKQSEHKSSVIDKLNAVIASATEKAEAERDAALARAVKVKPLVWPDFRDGGTCGHPHHFQYFVTQDHHGSFWAHFDMGEHKTLDDAKAHCDQHYQRTAIQPDPEARQAALAKAYGPILDLLPDAVLAAEKAMRKYPQPNYVISKWAEETGEVTKDLIHMAEGRQTADKLRGEIVQSLAMLHRLLVEGDQVHGLPPVGPAILALLPPADLAAKIGGE